jgi:hypothetical protein
MAVVQNNRQAFVSAGLTLLRAAYLARTDVRLGTGRTASFEIWDDLVRQAVCWLADLQRTRQLPAGRVSDDEVFPSLQDPSDAISEAVREDPESVKLLRLLTHWEAVFGFASSPREGKTIRDMLEKLRFISSSPPYMETPSDMTELRDLFDTLVEIAGDPKTNRVNSRSLGKWLGRNVDRQVSGICLRRGPERGGVATWYVEAVHVQGSEGVVGFDTRQPENLSAAIV